MLTLTFKAKIKTEIYCLGDAPACQIEAGQQKGGHFYCWICDIKAANNSNLAEVLQAQTFTLQERIDFLNSTRLVDHGKLFLKYQARTRVF